MSRSRVRLSSSDRIRRSPDTSRTVDRTRISSVRRSLSWDGVIGHLPLGGSVHPLGRVNAPRICSGLTPAIRVLLVPWLRVSAAMIASVGEGRRIGFRALLSRKKIINVLTEFASVTLIDIAHPPQGDGLGDGRDRLADQGFEADAIVHESLWHRRQEVAREVLARLLEVVCGVVLRGPVDRRMGQSARRCGSLIFVILLSYRPPVASRPGRLRVRLSTATKCRRQSGA